MDDHSLTHDLLHFLGRTPTPFHAASHLLELLSAAGFAPLRETDSWNPEPGSRGVIVRNGSSVIAYRLGSRPPAEAGFRLVGAHTDSPCLKLKPIPLFAANGYLQAGVEIYGGVLLNPWFDRDLSLAGRLSLRSGSADTAPIRNLLIDFRRPLAIIPSLAIHLDRTANDERKIERHTDLPPVLGLAGDSELNIQKLLREHLTVAHPAHADDEILDFELCLYDTQPPARVGLEEEFIASARLDNLLSCYVGARSLIDADSDENILLVCNDHEEVGSGSTAGARGDFLRTTVERLCGSRENLARAIARSMLVSTDNAHGVHPNFAARHDPNHGPLLNGGPAIKVNANQAYATNSATAAVFSRACAESNVPVQRFVARADMPCGSTIGPLTATALGVATVDVGVPTFAMHSIRELAGSQDPEYLHRALNQFLAMPDVVVD